MSKGFSRALVETAPVGTFLSTPPKRTPLNGDERAFIVAKAAAGLSDTEVARMFFRQFGRDLTASAVKRYRPSSVRGDA